MHPGPGEIWTEKRRSDLHRCYHSRALDKQQAKQVEQHPHWTICDVAVATGKRTSEVADLLEEVPRAPDHDLVMDLLIGLALDLLDADESHAETVAQWLYHMALAGNIHDDVLLNVGWWAWDSLALADARIVGTRADVINAMRDTLATAAERAKAKGHNWRFQPLT
jgi:hypothetical protein